MSKDTGRGLIDSVWIKKAENGYVVEGYGKRRMRVRRFVLATDALTAAGVASEMLMEVLDD